MWDAKGCRGRREARTVGLMGARAFLSGREGFKVGRWLGRAEISTHRGRAGGGMWDDVKPPSSLRSLSLPVDADLVSPSRLPYPLLPFSQLSLHCSSGPLP